MPMTRGGAGKNTGKWRPNVKDSSGPIYRGIVAALAEDIKAGRLRAGDPIPSQRELADSLGVNFTTITRAYDEARARGLIVAKAGQGTFVRDLPPSSRSDAMLDLASNWPPIVPALAAIGEELRAIAAERGAEAVEYRGGTLDQSYSEAGRRWLQNLLGEDPGERLAVSAGARGAFLAVMSQVAGPGAVMLTETSTWPAIKGIARLLGITLVGVETDQDGILPDALAKACREHKPKALYCTPTVQNPSASVMPPARRKAIAEIARTNSIAIIEDDAYGKLVPDAPPPIATFAPDIVFYVSGLAKTLASGMRVGYVVCPDPSSARLLAERLRLTMLVPPPVEAALATRIILSGAGDTILAEIRREMKVRHALLKTTLEGTSVRTFPGALHAFLRLPARWPRAEFINGLLHRRIRAAPSDSFAIEPASAPNAVRLSLGAPATAEELGDALRIVAALYEGEAALTSSVI